MLNQYEITLYVAGKLPQIELELNIVSAASNIFEVIKCLANYTKEMAIQHDLKSVKKCLIVADDIYSQGNNLVKDAIENVFVGSISSVLNFGTRCEKRELHALVPICLYTAYIQQAHKHAS